MRYGYLKSDSFVVGGPVVANEDCFSEGIYIAIGGAAGGRFYTSEGTEVLGSKKLAINSWIVGIASRQDNSCDLNKKRTNGYFEILSVK